ncbi:MAG: sigma-70 family RNA polymerase sigma factor [Verrucomicrobia bacterium]|nr:sigma-70 family RNA polymerase sigma factor [Verrucomicrobiota bacterium]
MSDEVQLLHRLRQGDEAAWAHVFPFLWAVARRAAATPLAALPASEVDDVAAETLSRVATRAASTASLTHLRALTATIAFRQAISLARRKSAAKRTQPPTDHPESPSAEPAGPLERLDEVELCELLALLAEALAALDPETRSFLWDKHLIGLSYRELADKYHKPVGTIAARVARGLAKVRNSLRQSPHLLQELTAFLR